VKQVKLFAVSNGAVFGEQPENYGDNLMSPILRALFDIEPQYVDLAYAELIGAGSILDCFHRRRGRGIGRFLKLRPWRHLHAWGPGFMNSWGRPFWPQQLTVHAVRGPLSAAKLDRSDLALGDPAILLPEIWPKQATATAAVSIVPHFVTYGDVMRAPLPKHWRVINLLEDPRKVSLDMSSSDLVISSSLHGLIVADAYGIPSIWMKGDSRIRGDGFKFRDYEAFRGKPYKAPATLEDIVQGELETFINTPQEPNDEIKKRLVSTFPFR
jgi:hypothetical protein